MAREPVNEAPFRQLTDVQLGERVVIYSFVNLFGCWIGDDTRIGPFVEIQRGAKIGRNCKIQSHTFICEGVTLEDDVFVGHGVVFVNDKYPRATNAHGRPKQQDDWDLLPVLIERGAAIGSGAIVLGGVTVGARALVGAGAVVTRNVEPDAVVAGNPARLLVRAAGDCGLTL